VFDEGIYRTRRGFYFTAQELKELVLAALAIALIFAWPVNFSQEWLIIFGRFLLFVGSAFIIHETAHKLTAQSLGALSEFRMWKQGLLFALLMKVVFKVTFIAPGATIWSKPLATQADAGKVSIAGPISNLVLALIFIPLSFWLPVMSCGVYVNLMLAFFNLLPFPPLDGRAIIRWNKWAWGNLRPDPGVLQFLF